MNEKMNDKSYFFKALYKKMFETVTDLLYTLLQSERWAVLDDHVCA